MKKTATPTPKKRGRPPLPEGLRRSARLSMRVCADVAIRAKLIGTAGLEALIRAARLPAARK